MMPGPDKVIACPACRGLAKVFTLMSGNTFMARMWTDGKMLAPMLPRQPAIVKCRSCTEYFWLSDADIIGEVEPWDEGSAEVPQEWRDAEHVTHLTEEECLEALALSVAQSKDQEVHLRILAWHAGNDPYRAPPDDPNAVPEARDELSPEATENLERLAGLLKVRDPRDRLMKAEIMRELGRFEEAIDLLKRKLPEDFSDAASFILELAEEKDSMVREIPPAGPGGGIYLGG